MSNKRFLTWVIPKLRAKDAPYLQPTGPVQKGYSMSAVLILRLLSAANVSAILTDLHERHHSSYMHMLLPIGGGDAFMWPSKMR